MSDEVSTHELEALRRRAYGPDADIDADPAALARLIALEDLAHRHEPAPGDALAGGEPDAAAPAAPILNAEPGSGPVPATLLTPPPRRTRGHTTAVVAIAVVTLALGVTASRGANAPDASAPSFTADPEMAPLAVIQIDSPLGHSYDHPAPGTVPPFPTDSTLTWAQPLGSYFGSSVWIARTEDGSSCLLLAADAKSYGQCVPADLFARGSLRVTVAYSQLTADERPPALHPDQSIAYQWQPNEDLTIVIGRDASR